MYMSSVKQSMRTINSHLEGLENYSEQVGDQYVYNITRKVESLMAVIEVELEKRQS